MKSLIWEEKIVREEQLFTDLSDEQAEKVVGGETAFVADLNGLDGLVNSINESPQDGVLAADGGHCVFFVVDNSTPGGRDSREFLRDIFC